MATAKKDNIIKFYTPYNNKKKVEPFYTVGDSMTQQQFAQDSKINNILKNHDRNGIIENINRGNAIYGDFSEITDFADAIEQIELAKAEFLNIPWEIREKFQNDAGQFFKYASNPENIEGMREMGLANPKQSEAMPSETAILETVEPKNSEVPE